VPHRHRGIRHAHSSPHDSTPTLKSITDIVQENQYDAVGGIKTSKEKVKGVKNNCYATTSKLVKESKRTIIRTQCHSTESHKNNNAGKEQVSSILSTDVANNDVASTCLTPTKECEIVEITSSSAFVNPLFLSSCCQCPSCNVFLSPSPSTHRHFHSQEVNQIDGTTSLDLLPSKSLLYYLHIHPVLQTPSCSLCVNRAWNVECLVRERIELKQNSKKNRTSDKGKETDTMENVKRCCWCSKNFDNGYDGGEVNEMLKEEEEKKKSLDRMETESNDVEEVNYIIETISDNTYQDKPHDGTQLLFCDSCPRAFCRSCLHLLRENTSVNNNTRTHNENWSCPVCVPPSRPLIQMRQTAKLLLNQSRSLEEKEIYPSACEETIYSWKRFMVEFHLSGKVGMTLRETKNTLNPLTDLIKDVRNHVTTVTQVVTKGQAENAGILVNDVLCLLSYTPVDSYESCSIVWQSHDAMVQNLKNLKRPLYALGLRKVGRKEKKKKAIIGLRVTPENKKSCNKELKRVEATIKTAEEMLSMIAFRKYRKIVESKWFDHEGGNKSNIGKCQQMKEKVNQEISSYRREWREHHERLVNDLPHLEELVKEKKVDEKDAKKQVKGSMSVENDTIHANPANTENGRKDGLTDNEHDKRGEQIKTSNTVNQSSSFSQSFVRKDECDTSTSSKISLAKVASTSFLLEEASTCIVYEDPEENQEALPEPGWKMLVNSRIEKRCQNESVSHEHFCGAPGYKESNNHTHSDDCFDAPSDESKENKDDFMKDIHITETDSVIATQKSPQNHEYRWSHSAQMNNRLSHEQYEKALRADNQWLERENAEKGHHGKREPRLVVNEDINVEPRERKRQIELKFYRKYPLAVISDYTTDCSSSSILSDIDMCLSPIVDAEIMSMKRSSLEKCSPTPGTYPDLVEENHDQTELLSIKQSQSNDTRLDSLLTENVNHHKTMPISTDLDEEKHQNLDKTKRDSLVKSSSKFRGISFFSSFRRVDPRYRILRFFADVARDGIKTIDAKLETNSPPSSTCPNRKKTSGCFDQASVFTIWRPCSMEAIQKMIKGQGVGKGLDIKGKSAKEGKLSGFVPFVQIHDNNHKKDLRSLSKSNLVRIFYKSENLRDEAWKLFLSMQEEMEMNLEEVDTILQKGVSSLNKNERRSIYSMKNTWEIYGEAEKIDNYAPNVYGIELPEKLLWEACVIGRNIQREGEYVTGRVSEPAFQEMNFEALRNKHVEGVPRAVLLQFSDKDPLCPLNLLMAYEENERVMPVVSDFDCLLVGTRRVKYDVPLPPEQVELLQWSVDNIEEILNDAPSAVSWTTRWLNLLKREGLKEKSFKPKMPRFGFGDPTSYRLMEGAIQLFTRDGAVRHGAECFNYYFPQELDEEFLIISGNLSSSWKYVNKMELIEFLCQQVNAGFTFPLNPKWVLCDKGMKRVYDRLMVSDCLYVQESLDVWYPRQSGVREQIERVYMKKPNGYVRHRLSMVHRLAEREPETAMLLAELELKHYITLQRARRRLKHIMIVMTIRRESRIKEDKTYNTDLNETSSEMSTPLEFSSSVQDHSNKDFMDTEPFYSPICDRSTKSKLPEIRSKRRNRVVHLIRDVKNSCTKGISNHLKHQRLHSNKIA